MICLCSTIGCRLVSRFALFFRNHKVTTVFDVLHPVGDLSVIGAVWGPLMAQRPTGRIRPALHSNRRRFPIVRRLAVRI